MGSLGRGLAWLGLAVVLAGAEPVLARDLTHARWDAPPPQVQRQQSAEWILSGWPAFSRAAARPLLEEYGAPDEVAADFLAWRGPSPFLRTIARRSSRTHRPSEVIEQWISYPVPAGRRGDLASLDNGVSCRPEGDVLVAVSESRELNRLALNVAVELVSGRRGLKEAKSFYAKTVDLYSSGKSSRYLDRLFFHQR